MTPEQLAHEFMLGIRAAMSCPDVSVSEYERVRMEKLKQFQDEAYGRGYDAARKEEHSSGGWNE